VKFGSILAATREPEPILGHAVLLGIIAVLTATVLADIIGSMQTSTDTGEHRKKPDGPATNVGHLCFLISRDMRTALDRSLAEFNLRAQPAGVLLHCCRHRGASPSQLALAVGTDTAGITGLIDQLEENDLVIRRVNPSDRRAMIIEPTENGRGLLPRISKVFRTLHTQLTAGFSPEEASSLQEMLQGVRQNAEEAVRK
jgi:DNA-binding MarR family transcriptional regulator